MSYRPATTNIRTRSTDAAFYLDSPSIHRENTRANDTSMCLENMNPYDQPMRIIMSPHLIPAPKKNYKLGMKKLGRKVRGVNSALPTTSLVPVTKPTKKVQSVPDSYDMRNSEEGGERYYIDPSERAGYNTNPSRGGRDQQNRRNFTPVKMMNYTFDLERSTNISGLEIAPSKLELYPNIKTVLQDVKQVDSVIRPSESRGKDGTLLHVSGSRTLSHLSKRAATPGTYPEYPSTYSRIDEVRRSFENTISRDEIRYCDESSNRKRVMVSSGPRAWDSEVAEGALNNSGFMITNNSKTYLKDKRGNSHQRRRREEIDGEELKQTYKENFLKLVYKGVGKATQAHVLNQSFMKNIEDNRMYFTTKIQAIVDGKKNNMNVNVSAIH